jgi:hypothetical protein
VLEFPEVFDRGGFDAIVGNPPFQGGMKISGSLGDGYRRYLVAWLANNVRGSADLVAYFFLRAVGLLRSRGFCGLIATNTLAQGDTREVGLEQLTERGMTIYRAIASQPWPGGATLEMATVWMTPAEWKGAKDLDRAPTTAITPELTVRTRVSGAPRQLAANRRQSFIGWYVLGMGFVLTPEEAQEMIRADARNEEVVRPYLVGEDLNRRPDASPARWVIDFRDWSEAKAAEYALPFERVERLVKPERAKTKRRANRDRWWQFGETRPSLRRSLRGLDRCIVITRVSSVVQPVFASTDQVISEATVVFARDGTEFFGFLASSFHWWWVVTRSSTLETRVRYTPTDCFETIPQPHELRIGELGAELDEHRSALMLDRQEGLTKTYNRVHDPAEEADDVERLRELHVELDHAVRDSYGWDDLDLDHGFHETKFGLRYTFAPLPRQEVLDRLLELNHERYADEVRRGLHGKPGKKQAKPAPAGAMTLDLDA